MSDIMRPVPFDELIRRIFDEFRREDSIFSIKSTEFYNQKEEKREKVFSQSVTSPLGLAAGPHTQLSQNIVSGYLTGSRVFELKTVQILDDLVISKPCIYAEDLGFNTEWSSELSLDKSFDEYLKAYLILIILESTFKSSVIEVPTFIFNASVGYNLEGLKREKMQTFLSKIKDIKRANQFYLYKDMVIALLNDGVLEGTGFEDNKEKILKSIENISTVLSPTITVSTMHGCKPEEIESICAYLMKEKGFNVFVKLNPTLLGYEKVRSILDNLGYEQLILNRNLFDHDLKIKDAIPMLKRLSQLSKGLKLEFGVKLTNTLATINTGDELEGEERYMSGRALMPLSLNVAKILVDDLGVSFPLSYSGGVNEITISDVYKIGFKTITVATDTLKPGGYTKLKQMRKSLDTIKGRKEDIDKEELNILIEKLDKKNSSSSFSFHGPFKAKTNIPLPLFDCYIAPCVTSCPINQAIPDYIALAGEGRYEDALALIYMDNPLPGITGYICTHECQNHCTRLDYEGPVQIREVKRRLSVEYFENFKKEYYNGKEKPEKIKAAVIGAGPAGLSAAYFLAVAGFETHVFEKEKSAGGVVKNIIPDFRIPDKIIDQDVSYISDKGANFHFNQSVTLKDLKDKGFNYILVAVGAEKSNKLEVKGNGKKESAISFLLKSKRGDKINTGKDVIVVGGGRTALDAARLAKKTKDVENVSLLYRRSLIEMKAEREEIEEAEKEGVNFIFLSKPLEYQDGLLTFKKMELGEIGEDGRRVFIETEEVDTIPCSFLISAIGEKPSLENILNIPYEEDDTVYIVGDALTGPTTVVECISSSREAVDTIIDSVYEKLLKEKDELCHHSHDDHECQCGHSKHDSECSCHSQKREKEECSCHDSKEICSCHSHSEKESSEEEDESIESSEELRKAEDLFFSQIRAKKARLLKSENFNSSPDFFKREASRCLECNYLCNKCVDVCPNRANVAIDLRETNLFEDPFQIVHLDAFCNECGNCKTFCPHSGAPYKDKFTIFSRIDDYSVSSQEGLALDGENMKLRWNKNEYVFKESEIGSLQVEEEVKALLLTLLTRYDYLLGRVDE